VPSPELCLQILPVSMPVHLQQSLCMLRCFNLQLGVHSRGQGAIRTCAGCTVGCIEDERHLLYGCSAYAELRQRYGVSGEHARCFQMHTVQATAKVHQTCNESEV
jgi:hypothetical protein